MRPAGLGLPLLGPGVFAAASAGGRTGPGSPRALLRDLRPRSQGRKRL